MKKVFTLTVHHCTGHTLCLSRHLTYLSSGSSRSHGRLSGVKCDVLDKVVNEWSRARDENQPYTPGDPRGWIVKTLACCHGNMEATGMIPIHPLQFEFQQAAGNRLEETNNNMFALLQRFKISSSIPWESFSLGQKDNPLSRSVHVSASKPVPIG